jgi:uncharacterized protein YcbX
MSQLSGKDVVCVTQSEDNEHHLFQFGNTGSGWKQRNDTRTVHIINESTVQEFSQAISGKDHFLTATRFRPNVIIHGPPPFSEFDWVNNNCRLIEPRSGLELTVISKTVRCNGVSVDPSDPDIVLDIPHLLTTHFPQHGPYLGVYAVVDKPGSLRIKDDLIIAL